MLPVPWPTCSSFCSHCLSLSKRGLLFHLSAFQTNYDIRSDGPGAVFRLLRFYLRTMPHPILRSSGGLGVPGRLTEHAGLLGQSFESCFPFAGVLSHWAFHGLRPLEAGAAALSLSAVYLPRCWSGKSRPGASWKQLLPKTILNSFPC